MTGTKLSDWILVLVVGLVALCGQARQAKGMDSLTAAIIPAASASRADVAAAIASASYGDTVVIPACGAGACKWTSGIEITKDIKIVGAGTDKTILTLDFTNNSVEEAIFKFVPDATSRNNLDSLSDTHTFEVSGITFAGNNSMTNKFGVWISNYTLPTIRRVKIHQCQFSSVHRAVQVKGYVHGVFYDNRLTNSNGSYPQGAGYLSFANDRMKPGAGDGWYIEDNAFSYLAGYDGLVCGAGNDGGGYVVRYNNVTGQMSGGATYVETHGNQLAYIYGPQITEVYGNKMTATGIGKVTAARGGKNIYFYNVFADPDIQIWEEYSDAATSPINPPGRCIEPGQGIGRQTCTDECICQKVHDSYFLNNRLSTVTGTIINAVATMDYEHRNNNILNDPPEEVENIEYFNHSPSFDGSSGVGCGTPANRPATCTLGAGYWATEQSCTNLTGIVGENPATPINGTLYRCTATNTWAVYFRPYVYPHPLAWEMALNAAPANQAILLNWNVHAPNTATWTITYTGGPGNPPSPITNIPYATHSYNLTGLTNYAWYDVTLQAMLDGSPILTDTVRVMPTDTFVYLPLIWK